jgi:hypothetical protein
MIGYILGWLLCLLFSALTVVVLLVAVRKALKRDWKEMAGLLYIAVAFLCGAAMFYDFAHGGRSESSYDDDVPRIR